MSYKDFDKYWSEQEKKAAGTIKVMGETIELPSSIPAKIMIETLRAKKEGKEDFNEIQVLNMAEATFTPERIDKWMNNGMTVEQISDLIEYVAKLYAGGEGEAKNEINPGVSR